MFMLILYKDAPKMEAYNICIPIFSKFCFQQKNSLELSKGKNKWFLVLKGLAI